MFNPDNLMEIARADRFDYDCSYTTNIDIKNLIMKLVRDDQLHTHISIYDFPNLAPQSTRIEYFNSIPCNNNNNYNIIVLNHTCARSLGIPFNPNIINIIYGHQLVIERILTPTPACPYENFVFIITPSHQECDDKIISFIAIMIYNIDRVTIYTGDDYMRPKSDPNLNNQNSHILVPVDIRTIREILRDVDLTTKQFNEYPRITNYAKLSGINYNSTFRKEYYDQLMEVVSSIELIDNLLRIFRENYINPANNNRNKYLKYKKKYIKLKKELNIS